MSELEGLVTSGLVDFESLEELRLYIRQLLTRYEKLADSYGERIGSLMRDREKAEHNRPTSKLDVKNWRKVGMVYVNERDPLLGTLEVLLESLEDYKVKISRTSEVLSKFEELEDLNVPKGTHLTLYLRNGVPLRVVVDAQKRPLADEKIALPAA